MKAIVFLLLIFLINIPVKANICKCINADTITTSSGLKYVIIKQGTGKKAVTGATVEVDYVGYFEDGKKFDSSENSDPLEFKIGKGSVIKGFEEGVLLMKEGDKFRFFIPYQLAYGEKGIPKIIPPNTNLIFEIELLKVN